MAAGLQRAHCPAVTRGGGRRFEGLAQMRGRYNVGSTSLVKGAALGTLEWWFSLERRLTKKVAGVRTSFPLSEKHGALCCAAPALVAKDAGSIHVSPSRAGVRRFTGVLPPRSRRQRSHLQVFSPASSLQPRGWDGNRFLTWRMPGPAFRHLPRRWRRASSPVFSPVVYRQDFGSFLVPPAPSFLLSSLPPRRSVSLMAQALRDDPVDLNPLTEENTTLCTVPAAASYRSIGRCPPVGFSCHFPCRPYFRLASSLSALPETFTTGVSRSSRSFRGSPSYLLGGDPSVLFRCMLAAKIFSRQYSFRPSPAVEENSASTRVDKRMSRRCSEAASFLCRKDGGASQCPPEAEEDVEDEEERRLLWRTVSCLAPRCWSSQRLSASLVFAP